MRLQEVIHLILLLWSDGRRSWILFYLAFVRSFSSLRIDSHSLNQRTPHDIHTPVLYLIILHSLIHSPLNYLSGWHTLIVTPVTPTHSSSPYLIYPFISPFFTPSLPSLFPSLLLHLLFSLSQFNLISNPPSNPPSYPSYHPPPSPSIHIDPMTWTFDKKLLSTTGFSLDPEKVEKLPGSTRSE